MRALLFALLVVALACDRTVPRSQIPARLAALGRPNLVLIVVDTLRADYLTAYGFERDTSPELSAWAARGVLFERVRSQSSETKMSMASLLTSLWSRSHGIRGPKDGLGEKAVTLAEVLREAGYATYAVQTNGWLGQSFGFQQGFDRYVFPRGEGPALWYHAESVYEEAVRLLDAHDRSRPFFLYLHFMDVHQYAAPPRFQRFGGDSRGTYLAAISGVDDTVRRVREKLAAAGLLGSTVMVLAADHGETFGEHGVHGHARNVLTPVVNVPLVVRLPFSVEPVRVTTQVRNVDLAPTLLELVGITPPASFEGRSLVPLLSGAASEPDRPSFAALGVPLFPDASVQRSVSDGAWTYARNATPAEGDGGAYEARGAQPGAEYLFDRRVDPGENVNLVGLEREEAERLRKSLDQHWAERESGVVERDVPIDPELADRLRALGYLR